MKISLITYHYSCNNGAVMQTYALCRFLREHGFDVNVIDLRHKEFEHQNLFIKLVKFCIFKLRMTHVMRTYYKSLTRRYSSISELQSSPPDSDCYIVGSDQVWNPNICNDLLTAYFLNFGTDNVKRISYASSFGTSHWILTDTKSTNEIRKLLHRFNSLSVREDEGKFICNEIFGVNPVVVLDPTFLNYDYPEFNKDCIEKDVFLCYKLNKTPDFWQYAPIVGNILGIKPTLLNNRFPKRGFKYCFPPSLKSWMRAFASAKFILTDSFHGIAFSLINRKQFVVILNNNDKNSRLKNIMRQFGLEDRIYLSLEDMLKTKDWLKPIDYKTLEPCIMEKIEKSRNYLLEALGR